MATVVLLRHGRSTANAQGVLAGRLAGVRLDEVGRGQADRAGRRLAGVRLVAAVTSPLERCRQTARAALAHQQQAPGLTVERGLAECDYGDWQGRPLRELAGEPLWRTVQVQPSAAAFPGGESMSQMQRRAVEAVRRHDAAVEAEHGPGAVWLAVSHGDLIKAVLADALGLHLDLFQRLHVDPASLSVIRYTADRPYVLGSNTHEGDLSWLTPPAAPAETSTGTSTGTSTETSTETSGGASTDAVVGGGAGPGAPASAGS